MKAIVLKQCAICGKQISVRSQRLKDKNYCRECWYEENKNHCRDMAKKYPINERMTEEMKVKRQKSKKDKPYHHSDEIRKVLREFKLINGSDRKSYTKIFGKHEHRIVAEQMMGRALNRGEVVHHIDRHKQNNMADNLMVFSSQAEHAKWHKEHDKGGDAK